VFHVDGLAGINEAHGRAAGDAVLRDLVGRVRAQLRPYDAFGRLHGEEFLIIVSRTTEDNVADVLGRVRRVASTMPFRFEGASLAVTVSIGGATGREESAGQLIEGAREALARAQEAGPDTICAGPDCVLEAVLVPE
jgi:diguanylate cyclase (GGDEF)-like protein